MQFSGLVLFAEKRMWRIAIKSTRRLCSENLREPQRFPGFSQMKSSVSANSVSGIDFLWKARRKTRRFMEFWKLLPRKELYEDDDIDL